jgi:hypothetical protein
MLQENVPKVGLQKKKKILRFNLRDVDDKKPS